MLHRVPQGREVCSHTQHARQCDRRRSQRKLAQRPLAHRLNQQRNPHRTHHQHEVVGYLWVSRAHLQRREESGQCCTHPTVALEGVPHRPDHQRSIDQRPHLGNVSCADNQEEIGRKSIAQCTHNRRPATHLHQQQHHPKRHHRKEDERRRLVDHLNHLPHRVLDPLRRVVGVDQIRGHTAEHSTCPLRILAISLARVEDIAGHTLILLHIVLRQHATLELRCEIDGHNHKEECHGSHPTQHPRGYFRAIHHSKHLISNCKVTKNSWTSVP